MSWGTAQPGKMYRRTDHSGFSMRRGSISPSSISDFALQATQGSTSASRNIDSGPGSSRMSGVSPRSLQRAKKPEVAKAAPSTWHTPPGVAYALDPPPEDWLNPVIESLHALGLRPDPQALVAEPAEEMARLAGVGTVQEVG